MSDDGATRIKVANLVTPEGAHRLEAAWALGIGKVGRARQSELAASALDLAPANPGGSTMYNGIKVLDNEVLQIKARGVPLWLIGLSDLWTRPQRIEQTVANVPEGQTMIALTHNPDIFPNLPERVPLLLAGHTHGGQVRLPFIGSVVQSSIFGERYERGHVFENDHHLFVTTGIGTSIVPVRFGVTPEIVLLTLRSR